MRYELLGSLRVVRGDSCHTLSARKKEALLAALVIRSGQVLSVDQLVDELWVDNPPCRATAALHVYISQLRSFLGPRGRRNPIVTRSPGYLLELGSDELDFHVFQQFFREGRNLVRVQDHEGAVVRFEAALGQWRGSPLSGVGEGRIVSGFVTWLEELRLECVEMMVASSLALGRDHELIGFLYSLVSEHPLHEAFYESLMTALHRTGRRADALLIYQRARDALRRDLGLEPCRRLRELHQAILSDDDGLVLAGR
ncbi:SARP family transcriptional regulator [Streptomyces glebosus]|uniref:SARP family transcriptional regulator n=1 Tax=Streptomyces glebosus TaxID=249580 RepID=A0A640SQM9_9ACTN|nr:AfsR/SARP family transcriptional regulator [Streptomyces glebosus]GFE13627.1 SARP family transcriptional regulator [Streptomyces glebosus]GHG69096.1 SARP family transcriptional regulator [Streptomyces glebosus]